MVFFKVQACFEPNEATNINDSPRQWHAWTCILEYKSHDETEGGDSRKEMRKRHGGAPGVHSGGGHIACAPEPRSPKVVPRRDCCRGRKLAHTRSQSVLVPARLAGSGKVKERVM